MDFGFLFYFLYVPQGAQGPLHAPARARMRARAAAMAASPHEHDDTECNVCMDAVITTQFMPCGHHVTCDGCTPLVLTKENPPICPYCRTRIAHVVPWRATPAAA